MKDLERELDWVLNKNWDADDRLHTAYDGIQHLGYLPLLFTSDAQGEAGSNLPHPPAQPTAGLLNHLEAANGR